MPSSAHRIHCRQLAADQRHTVDFPVSFVCVLSLLQYSRNLNLSATDILGGIFFGARDYSVTVRCLVAPLASEYLPLTTEL